MFNLGWAEIAMLVAVALLVFGPERLPKAAASAGRQLRQLRRLANSARDDLRSGLGPEFSNFDVGDLNPKNFVRRHLMEDDDDLRDFPQPAYAATYPADPDPELPPGVIPPFDPEAT
ncbi:sec-independent translocase [Rhizohabitans arisaemae]|uniref:sec-independent translocase n=1 Tax=Rhizohabitans arisaemae TaxID=2720610 RepID=UPI0024B12461|nr:sec-independent translocase [Rhizohabitans arisaemae]